jgi:hypothetical protein
VEERRKTSGWRRRRKEEKEKERIKEEERRRKRMRIMLKTNSSSYTDILIRVLYGIVQNIASFIFCILETSVSVIWQNYSEYGSYHQTLRRFNRNLFVGDCKICQVP